jgi:hypothetical protein
MASEAQIAANMRNAEKSTGPRTEQGKAKVAGNALRHGLRAQTLTAFDERDGDFVAFHEAQRAAFEPVGDVEEQLVERIALCAWRLRRVYRVEAEMFTAFRHTHPQFHDTEMATVFDVAADKMINISRYETALDRAFHRAFVMLERRQAKRRGEDVPAPIAVAVTAFRPVARTGAAVATSENFRTKPILPGESAGDAETSPALAPVLQTS